MRIGELARRSGLAPSRIRFYEASGLLGAVRRRANGYREYPAETVQLLELIASAQRSGFALEEIRGLLPQPGTTQWHREALLGSLRRKVAEIERLQRRLAENRRQLLAVIDGIERKPPEIGCSEALAGVLDRIRTPAGTAQPA